MAMQFCPKCSKILRVVKKYGENICICECGYEEFSSNLTTSEKVEHKEVKQGVIDDAPSLDGFPHVCTKCGYELADVTDLGAPYGDESNIYIFKCKKCGLSKRQTDGCSNQR